MVWSCGTFILSGLHCLCEFLQLSGGSFFLLSVVPAKWLIVGHFNWFCYLLAYLLTWHQWAVMWTITLCWCCSGLQTVDCCCSAPVWVKCWSTTQLVKSLSVLLSVSVRVVLFLILLYTQKNYISVQGPRLPLLMCLKPNPWDGLDPWPDQTLLCPYSTQVPFMESYMTYHRTGKKLDDYILVLLGQS